MKLLRKILLGCNAIILLPGVVITIYNWFGLDTYDLYWNHIFMGLMLPVTFLTIFFIPHIIFGVAVILYGVSFCKRQPITGKELMFALIMGFINIMGLLSTREILQVMMSV